MFPGTYIFLICQQITPDLPKFHDPPCQLQQNCNVFKNYLFFPPIECAQCSGIPRKRKRRGQKKKRLRGNGLVMWLNTVKLFGLNWTTHFRSVCLEVKFWKNSCEISWEFDAENFCLEAGTCHSNSKRIFANSYNNSNQNSTGSWLGISALAVFGLVVVGGVTRLTESGLSITEWKPFRGAVPPKTKEVRRSFQGLLKALVPIFWISFLQFFDHNNE